MKTPFDIDIIIAKMMYELFYKAGSDCKFRAHFIPALSVQNFKESFRTYGFMHLSTT